MIARLLVASVASALLLAACGQHAVPREDGGVPLCDQGAVAALPVTVHDSAGNPVENATITAKNTGSSKTVTAQTNADGTSASITSDIGAGTIQISAKKDTKSSEVKQAEAQCGDCGCSFTPDSITLTLSP